VGDAAVDGAGGGKIGDPSAAVSYEAFASPL
jgi:hypothetical protein